MPVASLTELLDRIPVRYPAMLLLATFASLRFGGRKRCTARTSTWSTAASAWCGRWCRADRTDG